MRTETVMIGFGSALVAVITAAASCPPAGASSGDWGLNGTYLATSNGEWAQTNDAYHDETSLRSVWTISTECSYPTECTGTVSSDFGWSATIYQKSAQWFVKRTVPNWQPCPDGTSAPGLQIYKFSPTTPDGSRFDPAATLLVGADETKGASGACGISRPLVISMPFKLIKQS